MSDCATCLLRDAGEDTDLHESIRGQRLLLALLNGAPDVVSMIVDELDGCFECVARLTALYLGSTATSLVHLCGSIDGALTAISHTLAEDIDQQ